MTVNVRINMNIDDYKSIEKVLEDKANSLREQLEQKPYLVTMYGNIDHLLRLWRSV